MNISQLTQTALEHWPPAKYSNNLNGNNAAHKAEMWHCSETTLPRRLMTAGN